VRHLLDPDRSELAIHATSSVHPIDTSASVTGWIDVDVDDDGRLDLSGSASGEVELDLRGMRSGNPLIDREAERRLQVGRHPTVTGRLLSLTAGDDGAFEGAGELDFHGVTRPVAGTLRIGADTDGELELTGSLELNVTDFGVKPPSLLVVRVHPEVRIELRAVAVRDPAAGR
jgi:polyisoprenoid-binding protein YceI